MTYGKTKDEHSFLYDPLVTMQICITGQLSLLKLIEIQQTSIDCQVIQANTDGVTFLINREDYDLFVANNKKWESLTKIELEYAYYDAMYIRDVNNYISEYLWEEVDEIKYNKATKHDVIRKIENGKYYTKKLKLKGVLEIDKDWYKDHSQKIVPIAIKEYFVNNIPIDKTIRNCNNIYDFCKMSKATGDNKHEIQNYDEYGYLIRTSQQKTIRYYVSNKGVKLVKTLPPLDKETHLDKHKRTVDSGQVNLFDFVEDVIVRKDRETCIEADSKVTIFNKYEKKEMQDYDINYDYYIQECNKIIRLIN